MIDIRNKLIIIILIIIVILFVLVFSILYFTTDLLKTNEELFWKYFSQLNIAKMVQDDTITSQENFKKANTYTSAGDAKVVFTNGETSTKQFTLSTNARYDLNTNRTSADITLNNGELKLLSLTFVNSADIYGIKCDDVFGSYVGIQNNNLSELTGKYGISAVPNIINNEVSLSDILETTESKKEHISNIYLPIIMAHISKDKYVKTNEKVEIGGNTYNTNAYKVEISGSDMSALLTECLNALKTDTETLMLISDKLSKLGYSTEQSDTAYITTKIDEIMQNIEIQDNLVITVYENGGNTIRINFNWQNNINLIYDNVGNDSKISLEISYQNSNNTNTDDVIDLTTLAEESNCTAKIEVSKKAEDSNTTYNVQVVPNTQNAENYIVADVVFQKEQDNTFTNEYNITINKPNSIAITYTNTTSKADTVEEIDELSGNNTAIANNYTKEEYTTFVKTWFNMFINKLADKMETLGVEEIANELKKIQFE